MESPREIVSKYYEAFDGHRDGWRELVAQVAEWARVKQGRICEIKVLYDPRGLAQAFGL